MSILNTALLMHFEGQLLTDKMVLRVTENFCFNLYFTCFRPSLEGRQPRTFQITLYLPRS